MKNDDYQHSEAKGGGVEYQDTRIPDCDADHIKRRLFGRLRGHAPMGARQNFDVGTWKFLRNR